MKKLIGKIKNSWNDNRVLFVLTTILIICLILIAFIVADYFLGSRKDKYGDRLEGIDKVKITDKQISDYEKKISSEESVKDCNINKSGKTIYINIKYNDGVTLDAAKEQASKTVELFEEKYLKYYDLHYIIKQDKSGSSAGFITMGAHNVSGSGLVWSNNNAPKEG